MEVDSSVKRVNDSNLEEISSATQQKRVKTMFETLWSDTNSGKPFQVRKSLGFRFVTFTYTASVFTLFFELSGLK